MRHRRLKGNETWYIHDENDTVTRNFLQKYSDPPASVDSIGPKSVTSNADERLTSFLCHSPWNNTLLAVAIGVI